MMTRQRPAIARISTAFRCFGVVASLCFMVGCGGGGGSELSTDSCGVLGLNARIVNGTSCTIQGAPVVRISLFARDSTALCSGTVIAPRKVLTAAHCFLGADVLRVDVTISERTIPATQAFLHPGVAIDAATRAVLNDVAVIELANDAAVSPVAIFTSAPVQSGSEFSIFGFGLDEAGNQGTLRSGEMAIDSISENHIFASFDGEGSNTCNGDSGGPALLEVAGRPTLIGITSSGVNPNCSEGDLSLFQNLQNPGVLSFLREVAPDLQER